MANFATIHKVPYDNNSCNSILIERYRIDCSFVMKYHDILLWVAIQYNTIRLERTM